MRKKMLSGNYILKMVLLLISTFICLTLYSFVATNKIMIIILIILTIAIDIVLSRYKLDQFAFISALFCFLISLILLLIMYSSNFLIDNELFFTIFWFSLLQSAITLFLLLRNYIFNNNLYTKNNKYVVFISLLIPYIFFSTMILLVTLILLVTNFNLTG